MLCDTWECIHPRLLTPTSLPFASVVLWGCKEAGAWNGIALPLCQHETATEQPPLSNSTLVWAQKCSQWVTTHSQHKVYMYSVLLVYKQGCFYLELGQVCRKVSQF